MVSPPVPQFGQTFSAGMPMPPQATVDVKIKSGEKTIELQKLPATLSIADYGNGLVVSETKEAILNEIEILKAASQKVIESIDYHKEMVTKCDELLVALNPQVRQEAERAKEMDELGKRVGGLEKSMERIEELLVRSLDGKPKEK